MFDPKPFKYGDLLELFDGSEVTFDRYNPYSSIDVFVLFPNKKKTLSVPLSSIRQIISSSLPLIGDRVIDEDGIEGEIISNDLSLTIKKENLITSHNLEYHSPKTKKIKSKQIAIAPELSNSFGGARVGAGRPKSGRKERKAIQLDVAIASKLPHLKMLSDLLDEFRPIAESGALRATKLSDFYKKLDSLPYIC